MNWQIVSTLVVKDLTLFFRNRFFAFVTVLGVVAYTAIYFAMPKSVDETLEIGLYAPTVPPGLAELMEDEGLVVREMESEEALKEAMVKGDFNVGVALPAEMMTTLAAGQKARVQVFFSSDFPEELENAYVILLQELAFLIGGQPLHLEVSEEVLGTDMVGMQIPPRDRLLPLIAVFVLMVETMGLASLITAEIEAGTLQALLITPMRVDGLFVGKGLTGVSLSFSQVAPIMLVTGGLSQRPILILLALLLGALMVTGVSFMLASVSKDMMAVIGWAVLAILILSIPTFGILFPGAISDWVRIIPSYYLVDTIYRAANFGIGWSSAWPSLLILLAFSVAMLGLGIVALRKKFR